MCQVEGIWNGFRDYYGSVTFVSCLSGTKRCKLSHGFSGFEVVDVGTEATWGASTITMSVIVSVAIVSTSRFYRVVTVSLCQYRTHTRFPK